MMKRASIAFLKLYANAFFFLVGNSTRPVRNSSVNSSQTKYREAYACVWLPGETEAVVAGRLSADGGLVNFYYCESYLAREDAVALYLPELPLKRGELPLLDGLTMPSSLRDAAPDAWGRRVLLNRNFGCTDSELDNHELSELIFLLESGSDRIGALDFQLSEKEYVPRLPMSAALEELVTSAQRVENGIPLSAKRDQSLYLGGAVGGARPKALFEDRDSKYVAKFSSSSDSYNVVKAEYVAMRLAELCGINVAPVSLVNICGQDVLLVERFDRLNSETGWQRKMMISALTILGLDEMMARYASYADLANIIRYRFREPKAELRELFSRIVFNILTGNNDDHARNHAAFWDGEMLSLTPAYDICPQGRTGQETSQAMLIIRGKRASRLATRIEASHQFLLSHDEAMEIFEAQLSCITANWADVCDEASLSIDARNYFWGRQFLNPYAFTALEGSSVQIAKHAQDLIGATASYP